MAVNWDGFKENVKAYFEGFVANDSDAAASYIALQYDLAMFSGGDLLFQKPVITRNKDVLETMIKASFKMGMFRRHGTYKSLLLISKGLTGYWAGATLIPGVTESGLVVISSTVTNPGIATALETFNVTNYDSWLDSFIIMATSHLISIEGLALIQAPTDPFPKPFSWKGYN